MRWAAAMVVSLARNWKSVRAAVAGIGRGPAVPRWRWAGDAVRGAPDWFGVNRPAPPKRRSVRIGRIFRSTSDRRVGQDDIPARQAHRSARTAAERRGAVVRLCHLVTGPGESAPSPLRKTLSSTNGVSDGHGDVARRVSYRHEPASDPCARNLRVTPRQVGGTGSNISLPGTGLLNKNPCISSQFSSRSSRDCSSVSTPPPPH